MLEPKRTLAIDIETFSGTDISSCGAYKYVQDERFEVMLFAFSWDYEPARCIDLKSNEQIPEEVVAALFDESVLKTAYNAPFERAALARHFGKPMPPEQWECDMVLGSVCGLPLGLAKVSEAIGLGDDKAKMKEGSDLIKYFCIPCKATKTNGGRTRNLPEHAPERWELFKRYCARDVDAENEIRKMLVKYKPDEREHDFWVLDQKINDKGVLLDESLMLNAIDFDERYKAELTNEAITLTGLENPNSVNQIKYWLFENEGIEVDSLNKKTLPDVVKQITGKKALRLLQLRAALSKTSVRKYDAMVRCRGVDGRARGLFQFYGSRTGRFAGRLIQLQNLPQNHLPDLESARALVRAGLYDEFEMLYENVSSILSELIRTAIIPAPSHKFMVCDFSAIEARVLAWFAKEEWVLEEFRGEGLIYEATASQMFKVPKNDIKKGGSRSDLRPKGKIAQLACGYGGGVGALRAFGADKMGMSEEEMQSTVDLWREANAKSVSWWWSVDKAALRAIRGKCEAFDSVGGILFSYEDGILFMRLPSGRRLSYYNASIGEGKFGKPCITYMGMNQETRKWCRMQTYGPKIVENIVQGTARDCLRESMLILNEKGFDIRMHIHDEVVCQEPIDGRSIEELSAVLGQPISWLPGLPLRGDGYETMFYRKDD